MVGLRINKQIFWRYRKVAETAGNFLPLARFFSYGNSCAYRFFLETRHKGVVRASYRRTKAVPAPLKAFICGQIGCIGASEHHKEYRLSQPRLPGAP